MTRPGNWLTRFALAATTALASADETADRNAVMVLERAWSAASVKHDLAAIEGILADDFVGFDGRGFRSDKAAELKEAASPVPGASAAPMALLSEELSDLEVRVFGTAAVLTALNTAKFKTPAGETTVRYRRTTVWAKRGGKWQCVSFHASRLMEPPKP